MHFYQKMSFFCVFLVFFLVLFPHVCLSSEELSAEALHSLSACLMDADSGRILYGKECGTMRANASTTKILTCILALEYGNPDDIVTISKYATSMPKVKLSVQTGEQYRLLDLLYSLMLESHNDSAVAIAEHIGGSVSNFAAMMNEKAIELGCTDSHFITPNGLDASETIDGTEYIHGTTAADLCRIMAYCIQNEDFLKITQTPSYSFTNYVSGDDGNCVPGARNFSVNNKNAFLSMMDGVISGKTGFTGDAGYCYVAALKKDDRTFTVALLGCGWPNNKTYKWQDASALLNYGLQNYTRKDVFEYDKKLPSLPVKNGVSSSVSITISATPLVLLTRETEQVVTDYNYKTPLTAPVKKGDVVGSVTYSIDNTILKKYNLYAGQKIEKFCYSYCLKKVLQQFILS